MMPSFLGRFETTRGCFLTSVAGVYEAAEKRFLAVILSEAKNLALRIFMTVRDSSSPAAPQNDNAHGFFRSLSITRSRRELKRLSGFFTKRAAVPGSNLAFDSLPLCSVVVDLNRQVAVCRTRLMPSGNWFSGL
jgi:hypothetical protein